MTFSSLDNEFRGTINSVDLLLNSPFLRISVGHTSSDLLGVIRKLRAFALLVLTDM